MLCSSVHVPCSDDIYWSTATSPLLPSDILPAISSQILYLEEVNFVMPLSHKSNFVWSSFFSLAEINKT